MPFCISQLAAFGQISEEDVAHPAVDAAVIDEQVRLEIVLETAEVEIAGTGRHHLVINDHRLGVKHSRLVKIDLDAAFQTLRHV